MNTNRQTFTALVGAGLLWGTTVPLSKLALHWLPPGWLTFVRFAVAAAILLPAARHQLRAAFRPALLASGAVGYGGSCRAAERRHHPDQRHPCRAADRHGPGAGRDHRGGVAPRRGAPGGLGRLRAVAGRRRPGRRWPWRRGEHRRGRAGARVAAGVRHIHGGADPPAAWPGPHCRDCRAVPGGRARRAAVRGGHRGHARRPARAGPGGGHRGPGGRRHAAALRPVRLRAEPGARRGRRGVPQHRAVRGCRGGRGVLRQPCPRRAARRGRGRPRGDRAEQPPAAGGRPRGGAGVRR